MRLQGSSQFRLPQLSWLGVAAVLAAICCGLTWLGHEFLQLDVGALAPMLAGTICASYAASSAHHRMRVRRLRTEFEDEAGELRRQLHESGERRFELLAKLHGTTDELELERRHRKKLLELCKEYEKRVEMAEQLAQWKVVEELRSSRGDLEAARDGFLSFLQEFFFPIGEKFEEFVERSEAWHERVTRIIDALDGSLATLGVEGGEPVLKVRLPKDPKETFVGPGAKADDTALLRARRKLVKKFHSDSGAFLDLPWATALLDVVFKYIQQQWEAIEDQPGAGS